MTDLREKLSIKILEIIIKGLGLDVKSINIEKNKDETINLVISHNKHITFDFVKIKEELDKLLDSIPQPQYLSEAELKEILPEKKNPALISKDVIPCLDYNIKIQDKRYPNKKGFFNSEIKSCLNGAYNHAIDDCLKVLANKIPKPEEDKKPQDIEIFVSADMQGKLTTPIYIGITEITHLGLYEFYGKRWWITETGRLKSLQDNKEPMPIGGICLNCGREVCICKCPKEENKAEPQSYCEYEYPQKLCGRWNVCKKCGLQINPQARKRSER